MKKVSTEKVEKIASELADKFGKINTEKVKQLGNDLAESLNSIKYQIFTIGLLLFLLHYCVRLNRYHNPE